MQLGRLWTREQLSVREGCGLHAGKFVACKAEGQQASHERGLFICCGEVKEESQAMPESGNMSVNRCPNPLPP
jgi:hypothetical protein